MPRTAPRPATSDLPVVMKVGFALACPFIAALVVIATFLGKEVVVGALWLALGVAGLLFIQPVIGIAAMTAVYLLSAYPSFLQTLGFLTLNNVIGLCLAVLLGARILEARDFSFLKVPQVRILAVIGVVLFLGIAHADAIFPLLQASVGKAKVLDKTDDMTHNFVTRLVFLLFMWMFVRTRRDIAVVFMAFALALFAAVPSALVNWLQGNLNRGFRAAASLTAGHNPNKLAMICLWEIACWWFWSRARPGTLRRLVAAAAIGSSVLVLLVTGSRSGLIGTAVLLLVMQTGPRGYRVTWSQIGLASAACVLAVVTIIPQETFERMVTFFPEKGERGASSNIKRETTVLLGIDMIQDHPTFGVGLGNFREVSRQIYRNKFYRPPHNSFVWAGAEGGVFVLLGYLVLLWVTWRDVEITTRLAHRDPELAPTVMALRVVFLLFCFFSFFSDLWLSPYTYLLIGQIVVVRRYLEGLAAPAVGAGGVSRRFAVAA